MLRRRSFKSKSDGILRKSTSSSVYSVLLEHLDPALARRDAHIAAYKAYMLAESRTRAEMLLFPPTPESSPRRQQSARARRSLDIPGSPCPGRNDGSDIRRQQSVRFMGPCSVPSRAARGQREDSSRTSTDGVKNKSETGGSNSQAPALDDKDQNDQTPLQPHRPASAVPLPEFAAAYLDALAAAEEYYTPEDDVASAPSSYRRLQRSKSSFILGRHRVRDSQDRSRPSLAPSSRRISRSDPVGSKVLHTALPPRAPKSMSLLGSRTSHGISRTSHDGGELNPGLAGVLEEERSPGGYVTPQQGHELPSLLGSRVHRAGPKLRRSLRGSGSTDDLGLSSHISTTPLPGPESLRSKARNVSRTVKLKLRNIFAHSKPEGETPSIPCQHIDSRRTHVTEGLGAYQAPDTQYDGPANEAQEAIHSVSAKLPSLHEQPPGLIHSRKASLESLQSGRERQVSDDASMTSWAHSGPNTLTSEQRQQWREWESQRLSAIRENGVHAPSPSFRRPALDMELFQVPEDTTASPGSPGKIVDSQRVYSALMKRMRELDGQAAQAPERLSGPSDNNGSQPSTESLDRSPSQTPDTIRHVVPERESFTCSDTLVTPTRPPRKATVSQSLPKRDGQRSTTASSYTGVGVPGPPAASSTGALTATHAMPPPIESTSADWASRLPASPASHLFRTASPYRRALRRSMQEEQDAWARQSSVSESQLSDTGTQVIHPAASAAATVNEEDDSAENLEYTESVYSTDDDKGGGEGHARWETRFAAAAANLASPPYQPPGGVGGGRRDGSGAMGRATIDWRTWLEANVGKLESSSSYLSSSTSSSPTPSSGGDGEGERNASMPHAPGSWSSALRAHGGHDQWHRRGGGHVTEAANTCARDGGDGDNDAASRDPFALPTRNPMRPVSIATTATATVTAAPLTPVQGNVAGSPLRAASGKAKARSGNAPAGVGAAAGRGGVENQIPGSGSPVMPRGGSVLRPAPLRTPRGKSGGGAVAAAAAATTPSPSVAASSPGLSSALRKQFGFGLGGGGRRGSGARSGSSWWRKGGRGSGTRALDEKEDGEDYCRYVDAGAAFV